MAEKILNTRLQLKIDSYQNWVDLTKEGQGGNLVLKRGEIGLCEIPAGSSEATTAPTVLFKVGDGLLPFHHSDPSKCLKWASAVAADVYAWAKKATPDWADFPALPITVVDTETGKFITGIEYADNTLTIHRANVSLNDLTDKENVALSADLGAVANLTTTAKTAVDAINEHDVEIGDLSKLNTTNKNNLVNAINEALQAVEVGGTGSLVTVVKENNNKYVVKQGGDQVGDAIEIADATFDVKVGGGLAGTEVQFSANATENKEITISHGDTSDAANLVADGRKYVTGLTFDDYGHVTGYTTGEEVDQDLSHNHDEQYKKLQTAYAKELTGAQVVAKVEQNANGDVTVTERTLTAADLGLDTVMHFIGAYATAPVKAFAGTANERDLTNGDVYLNTANATEYVYSNGKWIELGNEEGAGSHALKTITVTGTGYLTGGGDLSANRTIDIDSAVKTKIDHGEEAYGWGNHANGGYAKEADLTKVIDGTTPVAKATDADKLGGQLPTYYATAESVTEITKDGGTIDTKIEAYDTSKKFGDIITHNAEDFATKAQGELADSALQTVKILGHDLTKDNHEVTVDQAKTALGLGTMAYEAAADYAKNAELAAIAKTGNVNDLIQSEGDVLVFNCGTATTVI